MVSMTLAASSLSTSRPRLAVASRVRSARQPRRLCAAPRAAAPEDGPIGGFQAFARNAEQMLARYDFLSAGMGAVVVTGFCVAKGQDLGTALWITLASTVVALLVNDALPEDL